MISMSHRAVSKAQMGKQLKMFMSPDEIIDSTNKMDSRFYDVYENKASASPRAQWEHPQSGYKGGSLREQKENDLYDDPHYRRGFLEHDKPWDTMPPVEMTHYGVGSRHPLLSDGHHRLALAQARGVPYMAVIHHRGEV